MIAVLVGEKDTIELARCDPAQGKTEHELPGTQPAIDEQPAMIGRDERAVPGASASEHRQTKHVRYLANEDGEHKQKPDFDSRRSLGYFWS